MNKKVISYLLIITIILGLFCSVSISQTINVKDYTKDKFPSIFSFYLSSLEDLDSYEKEFIDLLGKLPGEEQEYYAKEVYKNGFSLELLKDIKEGKTIQTPTGSTSLPPLPKLKEKPIESLPSIIKRIEPSIVIVFTYGGRFDIALKKEEKENAILRLGSGFFISQNGDVITNYHVLQGAGSAEIKTSDGKTYPIIDIVAMDEQSDLVRLLVDIPSRYVKPLSLNSTIPEVGDRIIVYGCPLGLEKTVSDGIVSAVREVPDFGRLIQITAPISPGSSGSPVINMKGEVIGVATFQMVEGQNLNFAIPSERIARLNLTKEEKTFTTKELFGQEEKEKKDSDYAYEVFSKALYFLDKEEYKKALPYLEVMVKTDTLLKAWAHFNIGFCYEKLGVYTKAVEAYKQTIRIDPDPVAHYNLGLIYGKLGFDKDVIEAFKQAIRIDPDYASAYSGLGASYIALGLYKYAIEAFKQAIRIEPDNIAAHLGLGLMYLRIGDKNSALNEYKILKELDIDKANELFDMIY